MSELVKSLSCEVPRATHVQGIAVDKERKYMYLSFTTSFVKMDMQGNVIGSVKGLAGHLGCIAYNEEDGRVYGSLEYKHDAIGKTILEKFSDIKDVEDGFYIAIFDVDKIDRPDMDADGVMTAVYLKEVVGDFKADGHRYGCSGIDGTTIAPAIGKTDGEKFLYVAYGIYSDLARNDNDNQVILCYPVKELCSYEEPLNQLSMHKSGPEKPLHKYFVYTGNTTWGIQNLEYDAHLGRFIAAVYRGKKENFPNFPMYMIDHNVSATEETVRGLDRGGEVLYLAKDGIYDEKSGVYGYDFPLGATGMISLGDGYYYFSKDWTDKENNKAGTKISLYRYDKENGFMLV